MVTRPVMEPEINTFKQLDQTSLQIAVADEAYLDFTLEMAKIKGSD